MIGNFLLDSVCDELHNKSEALFHARIDAIATIFIEDGMDEELVKYKGENTAIAIQD
ncbi:hypothetical protein [Nostoc sp. PCC 7107]|uniref:hypothetical protein n=1 Tax=Nostoc sp. PCC 7107 TaxID=317936 RepID=UPI0002E06389|nr:hypothetical protein [Nostoc sp. PCC 7107]